MNYNKLKESFFNRSEDYRKRINKKVYDFLKIDFIVFSLVFALLEENIDLFCGSIIICFFLCGFFYKIYVVSVKLDEFIPSLQELLKIKEQDLSEIYFNTLHKIYDKSMNYYTILIKYINFSIFISQFSTFLILIVSILNKFPNISEIVRNWIFLFIAIIPTLLLIIFLIIKKGKGEF